MITCQARECSRARYMFVLEIIFIMYWYSIQGLISDRVTLVSD